MSHTLLNVSLRGFLPVVALLLLLVALLLSYLMFAPSPLAPTSWRAPPNSGYTELFDKNDAVQLNSRLETESLHGPESVAVDPAGTLYTGLESGEILRSEKGEEPFKVWTTTGGRPLGLAFGADGFLYIADAYLGLLKVDQKGKVTLLTDRVDAALQGELDIAHEAILYADDLDVTKEGVVYFTDASTKFGAKEYKGTLPASILDLVEHGGHGRLLKFDPSSGTTTEILTGLQFANGVALSEDEEFLMLAETGMYRMLKVWLKGERAGQFDVVIDQLPGFPDNVTRGDEGRFWVAFPSPRNPLMDRFSAQPLLRKMMMNLPKRFHPKPVSYTHIMAIDAEGSVVANLQNSSGVMPVNSSVLEWNQHLYLGSLATDFIGIVSLSTVAHMMGAAPK